jgi:hypothetical protein
MAGSPSVKNGGGVQNPRAMRLRLFPNLYTGETGRFCRKTAFWGIFFKILPFSHRPTDKIGKTGKTDDEF